MASFIKKVRIFECSKSLDLIRRSLNLKFGEKLPNTQLISRCFSSDTKQGANWHQYFWKCCLAGVAIGSSIGTVSAVAKLVDNKSDIRKHSNLYADIVEKTLPAVVHVERKSSQSVDTTGTSVEQKDGSGSGLIIDSDGLILTNSHVVADGSHNGKIIVKLHDGREFEGHVQMINRIMDLATVKIDGVKDLPVLKFADSNTVRAGEFVIAVGSPMSLENTVTSGIISNTHRKLPEIRSYNDDDGSYSSEVNHSNIEYIQTDAAINGGNSGGPLVNSDCEVIGINTLIYYDETESVYVYGVSFAIPSNFCKEFLKKAHNSDGGYSSSFIGKPMERKELGVDATFVLKCYHHNIGMSFIALTDDVLVRRLHGQNTPKNLPKNGVVVCSISPGSMAHLAGIEELDIITHINEKEVINGTEITDALQNDSVNVLEFKLSRSGKPWTIKMEFDE